MDLPSKILYTIGYELLKIDKFISILKSNKILRIIDVRRNPYSLNTSFIKDNLKAILENKKIKYLHTPIIAPTIELRNKYKEKKDWDDFRKEYTIFLNQNTEIVKKWTLLLENRDCLLCYEKDSKSCHRSILTENIKDLFKIVNI